MKFNSNQTRILEGQFHNLSMIEFKIQPNIEKIGKKAFDGCNLNEKITIPRKVAVIEEGTFNDCSSEIKFGSKVFEGVKKLEILGKIKKYKLICFLNALH